MHSDMSEQSEKQKEFQKLSATKIYFAVVVILIICSLFYIPKKEPVTVTKLPELIPKEYKIYEIKADRESLNLNVEIPFSTDLLVKILDNEDKEIEKLIDEKKFPAGVYNIKLRLKNPHPGKYKCQMETNDFVYETDFDIK